MSKVRLIRCGVPSYYLRIDNLALSTEDQRRKKMDGREISVHTSTASRRCVQSNANPSAARRSHDTPDARIS